MAGNVIFLNPKLAHPNFRYFRDDLRGEYSKFLVPVIEQPIHQPLRRRCFDGNFDSETCPLASQDNPTHHVAFKTAGVLNQPVPVILTDTSLPSNNQPIPCDDEGRPEKRMKSCDGVAMAVSFCTDVQTTVPKNADNGEKEGVVLNVTEETEQGSEGGVVRAYSIRIRPDKHAQAYLRHLQAAGNRTQNLTVEYLHREKQSKGTAVELGKNRVRNAIVPKEILKPSDSWLAGTPSAMRTNKVRQIVSNYNTALNQCGSNGFEMKYKSWRKGKTFSVEFDAWQTSGKKFIASVEVDPDNRFENTRARCHGIITLQSRSAKYANGAKIPKESLKIKFADSRWLVELLVQDGLYKAFVIKWDKALNRWYLIVRVNVPVLHGPVNIIRNAVSNDPGIKNFTSLWDTTGACHRIGGQPYLDYMQRKLNQCDRHHARLDRFRNYRRQFIQANAPAPNGTYSPASADRNERLQVLRQSIRNARYLMQAASRKVSNWVKTMHGNVRAFIYKNWDTVILPRFKTSNMLPGLRSKTARRMATFSFHKFMELMLSRTEEDCNFIVEITSEPRTSKTCMLCGHEQYVGNQDVITCQNCQSRVPRDTPRGACGNMQCYVVVPSILDQNMIRGLI